MDKDAENKDADPTDKSKLPSDPSNATGVGVTETKQDDGKTDDTVVPSQSSNGINAAASQLAASYVTQQDLELSMNLMASTLYDKISDLFGQSRVTQATASNNTTVLQTTSGNSTTIPLVTPIPIATVATPTAVAPTSTTSTTSTTTVTSNGVTNPSHNIYPQNPNPQYYQNGFNPPNYQNDFRSNLYDFARSQNSSQAGDDRYDGDYYDRYNPYTYGFDGRGRNNQVQQAPAPMRRYLKDPTDNINSVSKYDKRIAVLGQDLSSFVTWKERLDKLLGAAYLTCMTYMDHLKVFEKIEDWINYDEDCRETDLYEKVLKELAAGIVPKIKRFSTQNDELNCIYLAVTDYWQGVIVTLFPILKSTIGPSMQWVLKKYNSEDQVSFRSIYFEIWRYFVIGSRSAKHSKMLEFNTIEYNLKDSPASLWSRFKTLQEETSQLYGHEVVTDDMLFNYFISAVKKKAGTRYNNVLAVLDVNNVTDPNKYVQVMNNTHMEMKGERPLDSTFSAHRGNENYDNNDYNSSDFSDDDDHETANEARILPRVRSDPKEKPCFMMQKHGQCTYGSKCKYSHDPKVLKQRVDESTKIDQVAHLIEQVHAAQRDAKNSKRNLRKVKSDFKKLKKGKRPPADQFVANYEDVIATANQASVTNDTNTTTDHGDGESPEDSESYNSVSDSS